MASSVSSGVAITKAGAVPVVAQDEKDASHLIPSPTFTFVCWLEGVLASADENENVEAVLLGLGAIAVCFLFGYGIVFLTKCQLGFSAIGLG